MFMIIMIYTHMMHEYDFISIGKVNLRNYLKNSNIYASLRSLRVDLHTFTFRIPWETLAILSNILN